MRLSPRKRDACLRNLDRAHAASCDPERTLRSRRNNLQHGFYAENLRDTAPRVGESLEEFDRNLRLFERAFAPQDEIERKIVQNLAETAWRRRRMFRAQIESEARYIRRLTRRWPPLERLTANETELRAIGLMGLRPRDIGLALRSDRLLSHMERLLRALVERRSAGTRTFKFVARKHRKEAALLLEPWIPRVDGSRQFLEKQRKARRGGRPEDRTGQGTPVQN